MARVEDECDAPLGDDASQVVMKLRATDIEEDAGL